MDGQEWIWSAKLKVPVGNGAELTQIMRTPVPRHKHPWHWATVIRPDGACSLPRPLCLDDLQLHHPSIIVSYILALCKESLINRAVDGLFGGFVNLPTRRQIVEDLGSTGTRVRAAFEWLERLAVLRLEHEKRCFRLSPYVYFVGRQGFLDWDQDFAAVNWTPEDEDWEDFWQTASGALSSLYRRRAAAFLSRVEEAEGGDGGDADGEKRKDRKRRKTAAIGPPHVTFQD